MVNHTWLTSGYFVDTITIYGYRGCDNLTCCFITPKFESLLWHSNENDSCCIHFKVLLQQQIERLINEYNVSHFIVGMDCGVDFYAAEIIIKLKEKYPITLECAIQYENQASKWSLVDCNRYFPVLDECDEINVLQSERTRSCIQNYKNYIVDSSQFVIAILNGRPNGRGLDNTYSPWFGKHVIVINPDNLLVTEHIDLIKYKNKYRFFRCSGKIEEWTVNKTYAGIKTLDECFYTIIDYYLSKTE